MARGDQACSAFLAAMAFTSQSLPSTIRVTIMEAMVSPEEFRQVAAGSKMKPRVAMMGKASAGSPGWR